MGCFLLLLFACQLGNFIWRLLTATTGKQCTAQANDNKKKQQQLQRQQQQQLQQQQQPAVTFYQVINLSNSIMVPGGAQTRPDQTQPHRAGIAGNVLVAWRLHSEQFN